MAAKKSASAKKATAKKATAKKSAKKTTAKKTTASKTATKKPAAKKSAAKKTTAKKTAQKTAAKKTATKKTAQKTAAKKTAAKKTAAQKSPAKKAKPKTPFDKKFLESQRALLLEERGRYDRSATLYRAEADALMADREPGDTQFDEESGEGDTLAVERERDLALSAQARAAVEQIDEALARIDDGSYGVCTGSGLPIPKERLKAIPWATQRVEVKAGGLGRR